MEQAANIAYINFLSFQADVQFYFSSPNHQQGFNKSFQNMINNQTHYILFMVFVRNLIFKVKKYYLIYQCVKYIHKHLILSFVGILNMKETMNIQKIVILVLFITLLLITNHVERIFCCNQNKSPSRSLQNVLHVIEKHLCHFYENERERKRERKKEKDRGI